MHKITFGPQIRFVLILLLCLSNYTFGWGEEKDPVISISISQNDASCPGSNDGSISVTPSGGIGPYIFAWTGPLNITETGGDISNLIAGDYSVSITDSSVPPLVETFNFSISDLDVEAPQIVDPGSASVSASEVLGGYNLPLPVSSDNCSTLPMTNNLTAALALGENLIEWSISDISGNVASLIQAVNVTDDIAPTITAPDDQDFSTDANSCVAGNKDIGNASSSDNCNCETVKAYIDWDGNSGTEIDPSSHTFPIGNTTVTWIATDAAGNQAKDTQEINVSDNELPVISHNGDQSLNNDSNSCGAFVTVSATATDNCDVGNPSGIRSDGLSLTAEYPVGTTTITWSVTDENNNTATATQTITVTDDELPVISHNGDQSVNNDSNSCGAIVTVSATATDNCDVGNPSGTRSDGLPLTAEYPVGTTTITWSVTDENNNSATAIQTITVTDDELPVISHNGDQSVNNDSNSCGAIVTVSATATDNCDVGNPSGTRSDGLPLTAEYPVGTTTITWSVSDENNNNATPISQTIIVADNEAPTMTCVEDRTRNTDPDVCYYTVQGTEFDPTNLADNCGVATITNDFNNDSTLANAQISDGTVITWTLTDVNGNPNTCSFMVTVNDEQDPDIPTLPDLNGKCSLTVPIPQTNDNCDGQIVGTTGTDLTFEESGSIFWIFTDSSGNDIGPIEQKIIIDNSESPVPDLESLPTEEIEGCQISSISDLTIPTATDACDGPVNGTLSEDFKFPYIFTGTRTIEWEFIDSHGNKTIQEQEVEIKPVTINGGALTGSINSTDYSQQIDITNCGDAISIDLRLQGETGNIVRWEKFAENDGIWETINNNTSTHTASFATGALESTYYRAVVQVGTCTEVSNNVFVRALPVATAPTVQNLDPDVYYCLNDTVNLRATSNYLGSQQAIPDPGGDFNHGQLNTQDPDGWLVDGEPGGFTAGGNARKARNWSATNDHKFGKITFDSGDGKFAIAQGNFYGTGNGGNGNGNGGNGYTGNIPTTLESPILDLSDATTASLDFDQAYNFADGDYAEIWISIGGGAYESLQIVHAPGGGETNWWDNGSPENYNGSDDKNYYFGEDNTSISLDQFLNRDGLDQVRIKWSFTGTSNESIWALDNLEVNKEVIVDTELEWTIGIGDPEENPVAVGETSADYSWVADIPGHHQFGGTALVNSCRTYSQDGTDLIDVYITYAYAGEDITYTSDECGQNTVQLNAYDNTLTVNENNAAAKQGLGLPENCVGCDSPGTGEIGTWSWERVDTTESCIPEAFSDVNDPNATFTGGAGQYELTWTVDGCSDSILVTFTECTQVNFDGVNDHINFGDNYDLSGAFTLEAWVKPGALQGVQTIFSKRDGSFSDNAKGYDLRIDGDIVSFNWDKTGSIKSPHKLPNTNRWYHIALVHTANGEYRLYVDGIFMKKTGGDAPGNNSYDALLGAMDKKNSSIPMNYFTGWIEEVRIWNTALAQADLHEIMNQRINTTATNKVKGEVLPFDINNLLWNNLVGYYRMDEISCGNLFPFTADGTSYKGVSGKLMNITTQQPLTAPLPYISEKNGPWYTDDTWLEHEVWDPPHSKGINNEYIQWNIVRTNHNISANQDVYLLGLLVESNELLFNGDITDESGNGLTITHYLDLDGTINLEGNSQLVQTEGSILDENSTGYIDIDQQGTANSFNYNYWTSPVSHINEPNNSGFELGTVLKDGTNAIPQDLSFNSQYHWADHYSSDPKRISSYWFYTFKGEADNYFVWHQFSHTDLLAPGIGYTMKGTTGYVPLSQKQNYTFRGKPHNGDIRVEVDKDQNLLTGNPYPSAIDAYQFIDDNLNDFNGSLYFWDHFGKEDSHYLEEYVGGYAVMNKSGSVAAASSIDSRINDNQDESNNSLPGQYIPVGQAFFINTMGVSSPDSIIYKNKYRAFVPEITDDSYFHSSEGEPAKSKERNYSYKKDNRYKIRLKFESPKGYHRQILVTADSKTTSGFDLGYDAPLIENNVEDMYWMIDDSEFVIQGVPNFNLDQVLPLGLKIAQEGEYIIKIDKLENFQGSFKVFLHDKSTGLYHEISETPFSSSSEKTGYFNDRFEIVFSAPGSEEEEKPELRPDAPNLTAHYLKKTDEISLINPDLMEVDFVELYSISGQKIMKFKEVPQEKEISLRLGRKLSSAVYILKVYSGDEVYSRKIIINH